MVWEQSSHFECEQGKIDNCGFYWGPGLSQTVFPS